MLTELESEKVDKFIINSVFFFLCHNSLNAKVNVRIWLLSMKPNIKEFFKNVKESTSSHHLFFPPKYSYFHKIYYVSNNRFIVIFSELLNIYLSVLISNTINIL